MLINFIKQIETVFFRFGFETTIKFKTIMKKLLNLLLLSILINVIYGQDKISPQIEIGIDLTTAIIWASGGDREYNEFEFIYRESQLEKDLRFKLNITNYNFFGKELVKVKQIEDNKPISLKYVQTKYFPKTSYIGSIGFSKNLKNNKLPIYVGIDGNVGIGRGETWTNLRTIMLGDEREQTLYRQKNKLVLLGVTPLIGVKLDLTESILFGIEFGASLNTILGKIEYKDENGEMNTTNITRFELTLDRIINDIVLLIKI